MKVTKVAPRNSMFTDLILWEGQEIDVNMGLIMGKKRNYVIDTGLGSDSVAPILEYLSHGGKPTIAINTHYCFDHVWGACSKLTDNMIAYLLSQILFFNFYPSSQN